MSIRAIQRSVSLLLCCMIFAFGACNGSTAHSTSSPTPSLTPVATVSDTATPTDTPTALGSTPSPTTGGGSGPSATATPIPLRTAVYFKASNALLALNADSGALVWKQDLVGGSVSYDASAIVNGTIYFVGYDGFVQARNAHTGATVWNSQVYPYYTPTTTAQALYLTETSGDPNHSFVIALDAHTGAQLWKQTTGRYDGEPFIWNNQVWVGPQPGTGSTELFVAFDPQSGQVQHTITLNNLTFAGFTSNVIDGRVFFTCNDDAALCALDLTTEKLLWQIAVSPTVGAPLLANGTVFISTNGGLLALDAATGQRRFMYATAHPILATPTVSNGVAYFSDGYSYYAISATNGARLWSTDAYASVFGSGVLVNGKVILSGQRVVALNAANGQLVWTYTPRGSTSALTAAPW